MSRVESTSRQAHTQPNTSIVIIYLLCIQNIHERWKIFFRYMLLLVGSVLISNGDGENDTEVGLSTPVRKNAAWTATWQMDRCSRQNCGESLDAGGIGPVTLEINWTGLCSAVDSNRLMWWWWWFPIKRSTCKSWKPFKLDTVYHAKGQLK